MDGLPDFIGKPVTELGECFMIEDTPDNTVVECKITAFELGNPVIPLSVSHIQKAEIRKYLDKMVCDSPVIWLLKECLDREVCNRPVRSW